MLTKSLLFKCVIKFIVLIILLKLCDCAKVKSKFKRKVDLLNEEHNYSNNYLVPEKEKNATSKESSRGFSSLLGLGKVLNFFPVGGERECQPEGYHVARAGICLNPYDCRQREGKSAGDCAYGLGVCCVFEVTCGGVVSNNLTYFMSPGFPELWTGERHCNITIEKIYAGIMQLRIDFVHFTIGQPNRMTGECDEDAMVLGEGANNFTLCGQNHGQHIYYTLSNQESREAGELPSMKSTRLSIMMRGSEMPRLWLLRLAQMPLANSAPHDCFQYFTSQNGTIKSFNYAVNGRHLSSQNYKVCVRRNDKQCGVRYVPCDKRSFRIGGGENVIDSGVPVYGGPVYGSPVYASPGMASLSTTPRASTMAAITDQIMQPSMDIMQQEELMPVNPPQMDEVEEEGSGMNPQMPTRIVSRPPAPPRKSLLTRIWEFIWPFRIWGQARSIGRWSPYAQHFSHDDKYRYYGYGSFGLGLQGLGRQRCKDRVTIPCENEYFVSSSTYISGVCDPHHCGNNFCPGVAFNDCQVETSIAPFTVSFHFGPPTVKKNPEDNIGVCLKYTQLPCDV